MFKMASHSSYLARDFQPNRFDGSLLFFEAAKKQTHQASPQSWSAYITGQIEVLKINCQHFEMMTEPKRNIGGAVQRSAHFVIGAGMLGAAIMRSRSPPRGAPTFRYESRPTIKRFLR